MRIWIAFVLFLLPGFASAHEVYVLDQATIDRAMAAMSPNPFLAYFGNEFNFILWGTISFVIFSTVLGASLFRLFEKKLDPFLFSLKKYALPVARVTVGLCFIAFAVSGRLYGSELWMSRIFGESVLLIQIFAGLLGLGAVLGYRTRLVGLGMLALYGLAFWLFGPYLLTYTDFLGAALLLTILGGGRFSLDGPLGTHTPRFLATITQRLEPYAFALLRVCFGWGVLYASVYAKFIHSQLALEVIHQYDLTRFFPFDSLFVVLGALIIEFVAGLMVFFGIAIRWTLVFLAFWLTLSLLYFQELIWPHGILFGLAAALFLHGYDRLSLEGFFMKKGKKEPVF